MLSVEIIEELQKEQERKRQEREAPEELRVPVDGPEMPMPRQEEHAAPVTTGGTVVVLDMSSDDVDQFRIASW